MLVALAAALASGLAAAAWLPRRRNVALRLRWPIVVVVALAGFSLLPVERGVLALILAAVVLAGWLSARSRVRRRDALVTATGVVEACEQLAAELASGLPPGAALDRVAAEWQLWRPVAEAHRIGADVPGALRLASEMPGAAELRWVAAAWQVAQRTGQGLADVVDEVSLDLRADAATRAVVRGELASARATAKLVSALPALALLLGSGMGGDPWAFLLTTPPGLACLAAGLAAGAAGLWWIERIAQSVEQP